MKVTEQIDAMRALGTSPIKKLVVPRVLATIIMMPILAALADAIGLVGGWVISITQLGVSGSYFYNSLIQHVELGDFTSGLGKSIFFGYLIGIIACFKGLTASGGADGVGRATTSAVVTASISVLISDFFLTKMFPGDLMAPDHNHRRRPFISLRGIEKSYATSACCAASTSK